jgi:hypothetical protein
MRGLQQLFPACTPRELLNLPWRFVRGQDEAEGRLSGSRPPVEQVEPVAMSDGNHYPPGISMLLGMM